MHWKRWYCRERVLEHCVERDTWRWCGWFDHLRWGLVFAGGPLTHERAARAWQGIAARERILHCQLDTFLRETRFSCAREARRFYGVEGFDPWTLGGWLLQAGDLGGSSLLSLHGDPAPVPRETGGFQEGAMLWESAFWQGLALAEDAPPVCVC